MREGIPKTGFVVAIDGPAGSGKTTLARKLAAALGFPFVSTGMMYRALARAALERGIGLDDEQALAEAAGRIRFTLGGGPPPELLIDGRPPDDSLVSPEVEAAVSHVARHPRVREVMRVVQRALGASGCVMEGRDIGTMVFPDADVKLFLSAPTEVRAGRRTRERRGEVRAGEAVASRDALDARTNPLVAAPGAHVLDTTALNPDAAFEAGLEIIRARESTS